MRHRAMSGALLAAVICSAPFIGGCGDSEDGGQVQVGNARDPERLKKMGDYMNNRPGMKPAGKKSAEKAPAEAAPAEAAPKS